MAKKAILLLAAHALGACGQIIDVEAKDADALVKAGVADDNTSALEYHAQHQDQFKSKAKKSAAASEA